MCSPLFKQLCQFHIFCVQRRFFNNEREGFQANGFDKVHVFQVPAEDINKRNNVSRKVVKTKPENKDSP